MRNTKFDKFLLPELELLKGAIEFTAKTLHIRTSTENRDWFYKHESSMILEDIEAEIKFLEENNA